MKTIKINKLSIIPLLLLIMSCAPQVKSSDNSFLSSDNRIVVTESSTNYVSEEESQSASHSQESKSDSEPSSSSESSISTSIPSSEAGSSQVPSSSEEIREPGIYLERNRIGVGINQTVTIAHEVYPSNLGVVTWEIISEAYYGGMEKQSAIVTPYGQVTGVRFNIDEEIIIKGKLLEYEVYVTLMVFYDYDERVDTFYPYSELDDAVGRGNRYINGTTVYARQSPAYPTHYFSYDLRAGMTFNVMVLTRYKADRPKFYYQFGKVVNNKFVILASPFVSEDGNALLLGYDVLADGEYIVCVKAHIEINTNSDEFSYIKYKFWF